MTQSSSTFYLSLIEFLMTAKQHIAAIGSDYGLTSIQAVTLLLIDDQQPRPMKSFCGLYHCDASNVTGIIDGLEKKGLVSRQNDPTDRRVKVICLTSAGKQLRRTIVERLDAIDGLLFAPLNPTEQDQFRHIVETIAHSKEPAL